MKPALILLVILSASSSGTSQDLKVRQEAVRLMERANAVSSSPKLPNLERVDTFRAYSDAGVVEGSFSRVVIQGVGRREEFNFADFHQLKVWTNNQVAESGSPQKLLPTELLRVLHVTPIWLGTFDDEDVIHSIVDRSVGSSAARCIDFDTISGERTDSNEICVDARSGVIVLERVGGEIVEYSDFFPFAGALFPAKIAYAQSGGTHRIEISQTMTALGAVDANVLAPPPNVSMHKFCTTYRRAFGVSMPQPKAGNGGRNDDVVVRAMVGGNGRVYEATVQSSDRDDLNAEALDVARQWTFTPAICDGQPNGQEVDITLHFQGR